MEKLEDDRSVRVYGKGHENLFSYGLAPITNHTQLQLISVKHLAKLLRDERRKAVTVEYRTCNDKERQQAIKRQQLDYVVFAGEFSVRKASGLIRQSGLISIDIDHIDAESTKRQLSEDDVIHFMYTSVSGEGLKVLVKIDTEAARYKEYFYSLAAYFKSEYGIDIDLKCNEIVRSAFLSYDNDPYYNDESTVINSDFVKQRYEVPKPRVKPNLSLSSPFEKTDQLTDEEITYYSGKVISKAERMIQQANDGEKHDTLLKASTMLGYYMYYGIVYDIEGRIRLQDAIEKKDNVASISDAFHTIEQGLKYGIENPVPLEQLVVTKDNRFWEFRENKDGDKYINIGFVPLYRFLERKGFHLYIKDQLKMIVRIEDNTIQANDRDDMIVFISEHIRQLPYDIGYGVSRDYLQEVFQKRLGTLLSEKQLMTQVPIQPKFLRDTANESHLFYSNGVAKVTADSVELIPYDEIDGMVWKSAIVKRTFDDRYFDEDGLLERCEFAQFLKKVCNDDAERFDSMCSIMGYLLNRYRIPSKAKTPVFCDELVSEDPNGGTGKGLVIKALSKLRKVVSLDGKNFKFSNNFAFQEVNLDTDIVVFDDVEQKFDFEKMFSFTTDGFSFERKYEGKQPIAFEDSPHTLITTNYMLTGSGNSHDRRKVEIEFSQNYNGQFTPFDHFGHHLFDDWDEEQWSFFDHFMVYCLQKSHESFGFIEPPVINLGKRKLLQATNAEFMQWTMETLKPNAEYDKNRLKLEFEREYPEYEDDKIQRWFTQRTFNKWLKLFAECQGWDFVSRLSNNKQLVRFVPK